MEKKKRKIEKQDESIVKPHSKEKEEREINPWDAMWGIGVDRDDEIEVENTDESNETDEDKEEEDTRDFWFNW
ncbi:hypothetical protein [Pseudalkalibacillus sp. SCS-8]|uniref:hypothetical protein n=1 Tax=Pseudalkalibacillus nanhaiensis TaxID=3115291 RepID=UPI0032DBB91C